MRLLCAASPHADQDQRVRIRNDSVRAELRSAAKFFCYLIVTVFALAQMFSYSISYDTCRGHAAFTPFLLQSIASWVILVPLRLLSRASMRKFAGVSWSRKIFALDHARHRVTRLTGISADALFSQREP